MHFSYSPYQQCLAFGIPKSWMGLKDIMTDANTNTLLVSLKSNRNRITCKSWVSISCGCCWLVTSFRNSWGLPGFTSWQSVSESSENDIIRISVKHGYSKSPGPIENSSLIPCIFLKIALFKYHRGMNITKLEASIRYKRVLLIHVLYCTL